MTPQAMVTGILFMAMGVSALVRPEAVVAFFGARVETADYRNEIRAVYGGFGVCLGTLLLLADPVFGAWSSGIYLTAGVALFGMAAGRIVSFAVERTGFWPAFFCVFELVGAGVLYSAVH